MLETAQILKHSMGMRLFDANSWQNFLAINLCYVQYYYERVATQHRVLNKNPKGINYCFVGCNVSDLAHVSLLVIIYCFAIKS